MRAWVLLSAVLWYLTGGGAPPARPPGFPQLPGPASQLRPAPLQSELRLRFHLVSGLFFFFFFPSAVGWQRNSERTEKGFIYGKPGHPGNEDLFTRRVHPKSRGPRGSAEVFPEQGNGAKMYRTSTVCSALPGGCFILIATPLRLSCVKKNLA